MKKFLLSLATLVLTAVTASAQWAVVGSYTEPNWNFQASTQFTGSGDNLTCTIENLTSDFKIIDITNDNWDTQYGTSTPIEIGKEYTLDGKNGGADPSNIKFASPVLEVKNATVSWNPTTHVMKITAADSDIVKGFPTLYATGSFCNWNTPGEGESVLCTQENGVYTVTIDLGSAAETEFKLAGAGWSNEIAGGATITADAAALVTNGGNNLKTNLTGKQTLTFNINTMLMTFGDPELTMTDEKPARTWALVGAYSDPSWNFQASAVFEGNGDNLSCTVENLIGDFKIIDITNNNWDVQYGTSTPIEIGQTYTLDGKNGGADPANMTFAGSILSVKNATVSWNPSTFEMKISAADSDIVTGYPELYLTGSFNEWLEPGKEGSILCSQKDGLYSATVDLGEGTDKKEFQLAGPGWSNVIGGGVEISDTKGTVVTKGGDNLFTLLTGPQTLYFDYNKMSMGFNEDVVTRVKDLMESENTSEPVYYNLQGVRVANPDKGIYIVRKGTVVSKEIR